jgi:plastocyanin
VIRRWLALALAGLLGAVVVVLPSIASGDPPTAASFTAIDDAWQANGGANSTTIAQGGTITISYPTGASAHNADFGSGLQPTSCTQTAGANSGAVPPLPHQATGPGWSGSCTFNTPGTYTFHCDLHPFMTATVTVQAPSSTMTGTTVATGTTTTATTTTTPATTGTTSTTTTPSASTTTTAPQSPPPPTEPNVPIGPPLAGSAASAISVPAVQHGLAIHGSVKVSKAGAGGRLEVDASTSARSLGSHTTRLTRVGRIVTTHLAAGLVRFSVPLDAAARRALGRRGGLSLTVEIVVRSTRGAAASVVRRVRLLSSA